MSPVPTEPSDASDWAALMARAQDGDAQAYRRLLAELAPYLRAMAARYHRDRRDVEDTVQDILLTIHGIRHTYDPKRPFKPWLVGIGRRRIIDRLRQQRRARSHEEALETEHETFAEAETNPIEEKSDARALRAAVARLPPGQRQAVTLLKLQEMSLKDAAAISGMSMISLKVASHRGLKSLRRILESRSD
jgi:RNA polymerase sigma-70 factor (ECF subfamily)